VHGHLVPQSSTPLSVASVASVANSSRKSASSSRLLLRLWKKEEEEDEEEEAFTSNIMISMIMVLNQKGDIMISRQYR
jgi:hypothetical protein